MRNLLGTRADLVIVLVLAVQLAVPLVMGWSFRQARRQRFGIHRRVQLGLLALCFGAVIALEIHIRLAGGSGALVAGSPLAGTSLFRAVFSFHVGGALLTYLVWAALAWASTRRIRGHLAGHVLAPTPPPGQARLRRSVFHGCLCDRDVRDRFRSLTLGKLRGPRIGHLDAAAVARHWTSTDRLDRSR